MPQPTSSNFHRQTFSGGLQESVPSWFCDAAGNFTVKSLQAASGAGLFNSAGVGLNSAMSIWWTNSATSPSSAIDTVMSRGSAGVVWFGNTTAAFDNVCAIGDATHRLSNVFSVIGSFDTLVIPNNTNYTTGIFIGTAVNSSSNFINMGQGGGWTLQITTGSGTYNASNIRMTVTDATVTSVVQFIGKGTATSDSAAAGYIGEYISSTIATGSSVALTTNTPANVTSISLTAGDWDVTGVVDFTLGATTSVTRLQGSISTTSATIGAQDSFFQFETAANVMTATVDPAYVAPTIRVSVAGTTIVYLVAQATFTASTAKAYGTLAARRAR